MDENRDAWKAIDHVAERVDKVVQEQKEILMECNRRRNLWKTLINNKILASIVGFFLLWGIWVTTQTFAKDTKQMAASEKLNNLCEQIDEVKGSVKEVQRELKEKAIHDMDKQAEMYRLLLDIQKQIKRNNGR